MMGVFLVAALLPEPRDKFDFTHFVISGARLGADDPPTGLTLGPTDV